MTETMPQVATEIVKPQDGGQTEFLSRGEFEVLFGGAAGPGKSWALVVDALGLQNKQTILGMASYEVPSYRAVLFRRQTTELGKLIDEAKKYYPRVGGKFALTRPGEPGPSFTFPSGAKIFFCHLQYEDDKENHQGAEYQYVGFDELTQFTLTQYLYLFSRCRSTVPGLLPYVRSTTNPTGIGLVWVRKRFPVETPRVTKYFVQEEDPRDDPKGKEVPKGTPHALSRAFVPGLLSENKILQESDAAYATRIMAMGKVYEKALLKGDWWAFSGEFFKQFDRTKEIIDPFVIPNDWYVNVSVDPGFSSPCSMGVNARDPKGNVYRVATYYESQRNPEQHAKGILTFLENLKWLKKKPDMWVAGAAWQKRDRYAVVANEMTFADVYEANGIVLEHAMTDRIPGWWAWKSLMPAKWFVFKGLNNPLLDEMSAAVSDENTPEDIQGKGNDPNVSDHALEDCRYGTVALYVPAEKQKEGAKWFRDLMKQQKEASGWVPGMR